MNLEDLLFFLVLTPRACLPHGVLGYFKPTPVRPSPPPCGWSTGFIDVPRLCGLRPNHRFLPAFPRFTILCSEFESAPIDANDVSLTLRISLDGMRNVVMPASCAKIWAAEPAERTNCPPLPGTISTL